MKYIPQELIEEGHWMVSLDCIDTFINHGVIFHGTFQGIGARLLGLSYPDYLRFLQSNGGILKGKVGTCYAYFKDKAAAQKICNLLNQRLQIVKDKLGE